MDVDPSALASRLDRLSPTAFETFVADLWRARGWTVERVDDHLRTTDRFGTEYVLHLRRVEDRPAADVGEILVTTDPDRAPPDVRVVGPADLERILRYAVDRETARRLFVRTFGEPPDSEGTTVASSVPAWLDRRAVAAVLVAVAGLSLATLGGGLVDAPGTPVDAETTTAAPTETSGEDGDVALGALPPGVSPNGSLDVARLADAHREGIEGRPYHLVVSYREIGGDAPAGTARERIVVESANVYATDLFRTGTLTHEDGVIAGVEAYAEGGIRYQRSVGDGNELGTRALGEPAVASRYADRIDRLLRRYLVAERSRLIASFPHDERTHYWIVLDGDPESSAANVSTSVVVDDRGVVHSLRRSAELPGTGGRSAVVSIQYAAFDDVEVTAPEWYREARNRSATRRASLSAHSTRAAP